MSYQQGNADWVLEPLLLASPVKPLSRTSLASLVCLKRFKDLSIGNPGSIRTRRRDAVWKKPSHADREFARGRVEHGLDRQCLKSGHKPLKCTDTRHRPMARSSAAARLLYPCNKDLISGIQEPQLVPALSAAPICSAVVKFCFRMARFRVLMPTLKQEQTIGP